MNEMTPLLPGLSLVNGKARAIRKLWDSPAELEEIANGGRATAQEFAWDGNVE